MVDALHEARRSLRIDGIMVDLRPAICKPDIEVLSADRAIVVGSVDDSSAASDSHAADAAIRSAVDAGWFALHRELMFDFEHYWENVSEMSAYLASRRHPMAVLPSVGNVQQSLNSLMSEAGSLQLRCRWRVTLNSYSRI